MEDSVSNPAEDFYDNFRNYPDEPLDESDIAKSRFLESFMDENDQRSDIVNRLSMSIPASIKTGTKGSYIYGCLKPMAELGSMEDAICAPSCLTGFKTLDDNECPYPVWERVDGRFVKLNNVHATKAYVYAKLPLTENEIEILKDNDIETVVIFEKDGDSINYHNKTIISIKDNDDDCGCDSPEPPCPEPVPVPPPAPVDNTRVMRCVTIIIAIIVFILLAIMIYLFFRKPKPACAPPPCPQPIRNVYVVPVKPMSPPVKPVIIERPMSPEFYGKMEIPREVFNEFSVQRQIDIDIITM